MSIDNEQHRAGFEAWWEEHGQFCRAGGGDYEKTFAYAAWMHQADSKREASAQPAAQGESIDQEKLLELILGWENSAPGSVATKAFDAIVEFIHAWGKSLATPAPTAGEPRSETLALALFAAEAALADIGDADREPDDDVAWCEARAAEALPEVRAAIAHIKATQGGKEGA